MREIKFRAWDKKKNLMLYEFDLIGNGDFSLAKDFLHLQDYGINDFVEDFNLMQYTGLKDKNGKEIYEGDIVDFKSYPLSEVVYVRDRFTPIYDRSSYDEWEFDFWRISNDCEVVGNIYENPELLESEK